MPDSLRLKIVTGRNDGCDVKITPLDNGRLQVVLLSNLPQCKDDIVDVDEISPDELFAWINNRRDY